MHQTMWVKTSRMFTSHYDWEEYQQCKRARETASAMVSPTVEDIAETVK